MAVPPDPPQQFRTRVKVATSALGDLTGGDPQTNLKKLAAKLMEQNEGICAFGGIEAVFIKRTDGLWEENHAVFFGAGSWTNSGFGKYMGSHRETNPPVAACGTPKPPPAWKIREPKRHGGRPGAPKFDTVGWVKGYDYCTAVGFVNRGSCPVRLEPVPGGPWQDRVACELETFGVPVWLSDGRIEETANKNPWQRHVIGGTWVQVCTGPGIVPKVCSPVKEI